MAFEPALPPLPDIYTKLDEEDYLPLEPNENVPTGYFAGPNDPLDEPDAIPSPRGGRPYYWWNTDPRVNRVMVLKSDAHTGKDEWFPCDGSVPKYVIDDESTAIGKLVTKRVATPKRPLNPKTTLQEALKIAKNFSKGS